MQHCEKSLTKSEEKIPFKIIYDYEYVKDEYFFISQRYRENMYPLQQGMLTYDFPIITDLKLYKSVNTYSDDKFLANAWIDPNDTTVSIEKAEKNIWFRELEEGKDFDYEYRLGFIHLKFDLIDEDILAIAVKYSEGYEDFYEGDFSTNAPPKNLKLIDRPNYELKNIYKFADENVNLDAIDIKIYNHIYENYEDKNGVTYNTLLGLDRFDENDDEIADGKLDINYSTGIFEIQKGQIWLPYLKPFLSEDWIYIEETQSYNGEYNDYLNYDHSANIYTNDMNENIENSKYRFEIYF